MNVNKAIIVGRLTRDPEVRTTSTGKTVTNLSVATSRTWNDEGGTRQEKAEFHDVVLWGKVAEIAAQYLVKGQEVYIEGSIQTRNWEGKDGVKRYKTEIVVSGFDGKMQMGAKPGAGGSSGGQRQSFNRPAASGGKPPASNAAAADADREEEIRIEDIPF